MAIQTDGPFAPFLGVKERTLCPFARTSRIELGPQWIDDDTFAVNVARNAEALLSHLQGAEEARLHGFVSEVAISAGATFETTVSKFAQFVFELAAHDSSSAAALQNDIGAVDWNFAYSGVPIFLNLFAPCYDARHSKHIPPRSPGRFYIFFQPEFTFDFCNVDRTRIALKESIRERFADAGMPYDGETIDSRRKALSFVFPDHANASPVAWWQEPYRTPSQSGSSPGNG